MARIASGFMLMPLAEVKINKMVAYAVDEKKFTKAQRIKKDEGIIGLLDQLPFAPSYGGFYA